MVTEWTELYVDFNQASSFCPETKSHWGKNDLWAYKTTQVDKKRSITRKSFSNEHTGYMI